MKFDKWKILLKIYHQFVAIFFSMMNEELAHDSIVMKKSTVESRLRDFEHFGRD